MRDGWVRGLQALIRRRIWRMDIADSARIARSAYIDRTFPAGIHIGADAVVDEEAIVLTHDMTRNIYLETRIGPRSHIGPRAVIMPGMVVGADCEVIAGALVNRDVPDGHRAIGNPARIEPR